MSSNDDFKSFTIGGLGGPMGGVGRPRPTAPSPTPAPSAPAAAPAGEEKSPDEKNFPVLEGLLEADVDEVQAMADRMNATCAALDELIEKRTGRVKAEAEKARAAYDRTFDLIDHLMEVKASLLGG